MLLGVCHLPLICLPDIHIEDSSTTALRHVFPTYGARVWLGIRIRRTYWWWPWTWRLHGTWIMVYHFVWQHRCMNQSVLTHNIGYPKLRLVCHSNQNCRVGWNKVFWTIHVMVGRSSSLGCGQTLGNINMFIFGDIWRCLPLGHSGKLTFACAT